MVQIGIEPDGAATRTSPALRKRIGRASACRTSCGGSSARRDRRSLRTSDAVEAKRRVRIERIKVEAEFDEARRQLTARAPATEQTSPIELSVGARRGGANDAGGCRGAGLVSPLPESSCAAQSVLSGRSGPHQRP
ncbi:DUF6538 domain-containing protein [Chelatococcus sp. GCM10030263]|uniref:DUF6538 domain-containing protein n=1 Tax=Chelatococcus sp. GCM10030263 TaxID=3273387 RepID=UPI00360F9149